MRFLINKAAVLSLAALISAAPPVCAESGKAAFSFKEVSGLIGLVYGGKENYKIEKSNQRGDWKGTMRCYWTLLCSDRSRKLRMEITKNISAVSADKIVKERWSRIKMLYSGNAAYPGMLTREFEVPDELKPVIISSGPAALTGMLYATANMTYGAGAQDLAAYRSVMTLRYCEKNATLSQIEMFIPKKEFEKGTALKEIEAFACVDK